MSAPSASPTPTPLSSTQLSALSQNIKHWAQALGFQQVGISGVDPGIQAEYLEQWVAAGYHGEMHYMAAHGRKRAYPAELEPGTLRLICVRMDYLPADTQMAQCLSNPEQAYISRYALGRDYHKLLRKRLQQLAERIQATIGPFGHRAFVDSAPVLEKAFAQQAGLGWMGQNTLLINPKAGSWFFLGELFVNLPLPVDPPYTKNHCGSCQSCLKRCPTGALLGNGLMDARRCISYLSIELKGSIPEPLRPLMGNRIYGCDDCQIACPWNRFARPTSEADFLPRHQLETSSLMQLFQWTEAEFLTRTEGSPIRRAGYERWSRNLAVALGNVPSNPAIQQALKQRLNSASSLVAEHINWALKQHTI